MQLWERKPWQLWNCMENIRPWTESGRYWMTVKKGRTLQMSVFCGMAELKLWKNQSFPAVQMQGLPEFREQGNCMTVYVQLWERTIKMAVSLTGNPR